MTRRHAPPAAVIATRDPDGDYWSFDGTRYVLSYVRQSSPLGTFQLPREGLHALLRGRSWYDAASGRDYAVGRWHILASGCGLSLPREFLRRLQPLTPARPAPPAWHHPHFTAYENGLVYEGDGEYLQVHYQDLLSLAQGLPAFNFLTSSLYWDRNLLQFSYHETPLVNTGISRDQLWALLRQRYYLEPTPECL